MPTPLSFRSLRQTHTVQHRFNILLTTWVVLLEGDRANQTYVCEDKNSHCQPFYLPICSAFCLPTCNIMGDLSANCFHG